MKGVSLTNKESPACTTKYPISVTHQIGIVEKRVNNPKITNIGQTKFAVRIAPSFNHEVSQKD
jgi:hypothetical protein